MNRSNKEKLISSIGLAMAGVTALAPLHTMAINTQASVKVKNAITFAETAPLSFGTVRANYNAGIGSAANALASAARLALPADDTATMTATAGLNSMAINSLVRGSSAKYTITGAAPFTQITFTITDITSAANTNIALTTPNPSAPNFEIVQDSWTARDLVLAAPISIANATGKGLVTTDGAGAASFSLGASIRTDQTAKTQNYDQNNEVDYTGQFSITVSY